MFIQSFICLTEEIKEDQGNFTSSVPDLPDMLCFSSLSPSRSCSLRARSLPLGGQSTSLVFHWCRLKILPFAVRQTRCFTSFISIELFSFFSFWCWCCCLACARPDYLPLSPTMTIKERKREDEDILVSMCWRHPLALLSSQTYRIESTLLTSVHRRERERTKTGCCIGTSFSFSFFLFFSSTRVRTRKVLILSGTLMTCSHSFFSLLERHITCSDPNKFDKTFKCRSSSSWTFGHHQQIEYAWCSFKSSEEVFNKHRNLSRKSLRNALDCNCESISCESTDTCLSSSSNRSDCGKRREYRFFSLGWLEGSTTIIFPSDQITGERRRTRTSMANRRVSREKKNQFPSTCSEVFRHTNVRVC